MFCTSCGAQLQDGTKFCTKCGAQLINSAPGPAPQPIPQANPMPQSNPVPQASKYVAAAPQPVPAAPATKTCSACGAENPGTTQYCVKCGAELGGGSSIGFKDIWGKMTADKTNYLKDQFFLISWIAGMVCGFMVFISTFLPFIKLEGRKDDKGYNLFQTTSKTNFYKKYSDYSKWPKKVPVGNGYALLFVLIALIGIACFALKTTIGALITGGLSFLVSLIAFFDIKDDIGDDEIKIGIALIFLIIFSILMVAAAVIMFLRKMQIKNGKVQLR